MSRRKTFLTIVYFVTSMNLLQATYVDGLVSETLFQGTTLIPVTLKSYWMGMRLFPMFLIWLGTGATSLQSCWLQRGRVDTPTLSSISVFLLMCYALGMSSSFYRWKKWPRSPKTGGKSAPHFRPPHGLHPGCRWASPVARFQPVLSHLPPHACTACPCLHSGLPLTLLLMSRRFLFGFSISHSFHSFLHISFYCFLSCPHLTSLHRKSHRFSFLLVAAWVHQKSPQLLSPLRR